jgi:tetratricopeptide (TPR) repeat protein
MKAFSSIMLLGLATLLWARPADANSTNSVPPVEPVTARDFYNAGTRQLQATNYPEAERLFQTALSKQDESVQPPTLFNLAHTRFAMGKELLKKAPEEQALKNRGNNDIALSEQVNRRAESALASDDVERMVAAYLAGQGMRRELKAAEKAVQSALEIYGKTLQKWQRSSDDFKGTAELRPADTNAAYNAEVVDRHIARLVDQLQQMQQLAQRLGQQRQQLGKMLTKLKGKIPAPNAPPGSGGEEDEDEGENGVKPESLQGREENAGREGNLSNAPLSPDQAGQMLDGLPVDGNRRLSMSDQQGTPPKARNGRNW